MQDFLRVDNIDMDVMNIFSANEERERDMGRFTQYFRAHHRIHIHDTTDGQVHFLNKEDILCVRNNSSRIVNFSNFFCKIVK